LNFQFINSVRAQNASALFFAKFLLYVIWNWNGTDVHAADWLLVSLCYPSSHLHSTDLCTQCEPCTWISVARTKGLLDWQHNFP